jgi:arylformamidase
VEIIDISLPIRPGMDVYPGDPVVKLERVRSIAAGDGYNLTRLDFGVHSGTHVDAPVHFIDGAAGTDSLPVDVLIGSCVVVDGISVPDGAERVLFKTGGSGLALEAETAQEVVEKEVRLVGIDYLSIGDEDAHRILLGAGVVALEGIDLHEVEAGGYELFCAPLNLVGSDGAPARVFLRR